MTPFIKKKDIKNNWYLVNAKDLVVGRLAAYISVVLRGKNKPQYNPNQDNGDFVIVTNIEKLKFTGKKFENKKYYKHTGYPGGIRSEGIGERMSRKPDQVLIGAVKRMLPKGPLGRDMLSKLKAFQGDSHRHEAQMPSNIEETEFWEK